MILVVVPTGMKVKSAILFSMSLMILSRPLLKNIPELVRTLQIKMLSVLSGIELLTKSRVRIK